MIPSLYNMYKAAPRATKRNTVRARKARSHSLIMSKVSLGPGLLLNKNNHTSNTNDKIIITIPQIIKGDP
ncbi:MAG: hypothetical protein FWH46_03155 [Methanimicrococcus sp.]|nr:hypothetical protein [Methanimicrococcus sp.]